LLQVFGRDAISVQTAMNTIPSKEPAKNIYSSEQGLITSSKDLGWEFIVLKEYQLPPTQGSYPAFEQHDLTLCLTTRPHRIHQVMGHCGYEIPRDFNGAVGIFRYGDVG